MTQIERTVSALSTKLTTRSLSCSSSSSSRKQNRTEFAKYYTDLCHIQHSHPLNAIKQNLDKGILDFYCDRIKFDEWWSIINALAADRTLHLIAIRSRHPQKQAIESADTELKARAIMKQPVFLSRFVMLWLMESIKQCLSQSTSLTVLEFEGLPLAGDYLVLLSQGLADTTSLQHLSFYKCNIGDEGADIICHTIKNIPCILSLDLSYCDLTNRGAEVLSEMIKYQKLNRYSEAWKQTLRYRDPDVEAMPGLRRITINGNNDIGDKGIAILTEEIKDDLWLRALDVQDCGLTDEGGISLIELLESNRNLVIVDARGNPYMSEEILAEIMNHLSVNNQGKSDTDYRWINKNPNLNKKNFQVANLKPRPWSCHSGSRATNKPSVNLGCGTEMSSRVVVPHMLRMNAPVNQKVKNERKITDKTSENECLRMQLRDLTILLNQEVHHKLALLEENKKLKESLEEYHADRRKMEGVQGSKVLIAEDTLKVLEDTIKKFGIYVSEKQKEEDETSESTTARSILTDEPEIPEMVSNMKMLLREPVVVNHNNSNTINKCQKQKDKIICSSHETEAPSAGNKKAFLDMQSKQVDDNNKRNRDGIKSQKKCVLFRNEDTDSIIWEVDEMNSMPEFSKPVEKLKSGNKLKAQVMFMKIMEEGLKEKTPQEVKLKHMQMLNVPNCNGANHDIDNESTSNYSECALNKLTGEE